MPQYLIQEDIRLARAPEHLLTLFRKLGYQTDPAPIPLDPDELELPQRAGIQRFFFLADHGQLQVLLFELDAVLMANLRPLARDLLQRGGNYLIVATPGPPPYQKVAFVNPRRVGEGTRLTVGIRKLVVEPGHPTRHDLDILEAIAAFGKVDDPATLYEAQVKAFDVERLTNRFYRAYAELFRATIESIREWNKGHPILAAEEGSHAFAQRLLSRLMFLYFLQRKGWLAGDPRFLTTWYRQIIQDEGRYWDEFLRPLFFDTLNRRRIGDASDWGNIPYLNGGLFEAQEPDLDPTVYLPNELFDPHASEGLLGFLNRYNFTIAEDTPLDEEVALDPELLGKVFENLLEAAERGETGTFYTPRSIVHYLARSALRLYLADSTGLPEERLAALFAVEREEVAAPDLTPQEADRIERALEKLRALDPAVGSGAFLVGLLQELVHLRRLCWLAHGHTPADIPPVARWKRDFIAHSLYGVDIKAEAVEIARLRLWLSLVVDQRREEVEPLPNLDYRLMKGNSLLETLDGEPILDELPQTGSLLQGALPGVPAPAQQLGLGLEESSQARRGLTALKEQYFTAETKAERDRLRQQIEAQERALVLAALDEKLAAIDTRVKRLVAKGSQVNWQGMRKEQKRMEALAHRQARLSELAARVRRGEPLPFFLYRLHFFEVFRDKGGFDLVLANPPYVRHEHFGEMKAALKAEYPQVYHGMADLYVYFYARGLNLLRDRGVLAYISSDKFLRAGYAKKLRSFLRDEVVLSEVIDYGELPVFDAVIEPITIVAHNTKPQPTHKFHTATIDDIETLERLEEYFQNEMWPVTQQMLREDGWSLEHPDVLALLEKLRETGTLLDEYIEGRFYYGIKTGYNKAFVIDEATRQQLIAQDPRSDEVIKPWLRGRDIKRWRIEWDNLYLIAVQNSGDAGVNNPWGEANTEQEAINIFKDTYPAIYEHLQHYEEKLRSRHDQGRFWWELRACAYYAEFEKPKIVYADIARSYKFTYDLDEQYLANTCYLIPTNDLYLLGVLSSAAMEFFCHQLTATEPGGFVRLHTIYVRQLPIPDAPLEERQAIERLVRRLLELRGQGPEVPALEGEINERVYRLFGLSRAEIELIEGGLASVRLGVNPQAQS